MKRPAVILALAFAAFPLRVPLARAEADPTEKSPDRPWAKNVAEETQKQALALFEEGNKLFEDSQYVPALAKYRQALGVWDHPAIRYNAAVALINLDQPLAANENLELALSYGAAPFNAETYQQALTYRKLLRGQLSELKVTCAEPGAEVTLDGAPLFIAPGEANRWLLPGAHQLVARKTGFLAETRSLGLLGGRPAVESLALQELRSSPPRTVRRWSPWKPWAVLGGGVLLATVGVPLILHAQSNLDGYDAMVAGACATGCPPGTIPQTALDAHDRARWENIAAISLFSVGGAIAAGGVALLFLNQPRVLPAEGPSHAAVIPLPLLGPGVLGLSLAFQR